MWKFIKSLFRKDEGQYQFITLIAGKMHKESEWLSSGNLYWCYYNSTTKRFRINVGHATITGYVEYYPSDDFFLKYLFHNDYDANLHNSEELAEQRKRTEELIRKVDEYNNAS